MHFLIAPLVAALCVLPAANAAPVGEPAPPATPAPPPCGPPQVNEATLDLITSSEGFRPHPYDDGVKDSIGFGHQCDVRGCPDQPQPMTHEQARLLMRQDLAEFERGITMGTWDNVVLNDNEYGALVSFSYNLGNANDLLALLNRGDNPQTVIQEQVPKYNKANGVVLPGLVKRRQAEVNLAKLPAPGVLPVPCLIG